MKKLSVLFLVILLTGVTFPLDEHSDLKGLHWLQGQWKGELGKATYYETWKSTHHGTLEGSAAMKNQEGKIIFTEVLRIDKIGSHIVYIASVNNSKPVLFTLIEAPGESNRPRWVFENKEHDFPQRIIYIREAQDSLLARVEGVQKGKEEKEEFRLKREY